MEKKKYIAPTIIVFPLEPVTLLAASQGAPSSIQVGEDLPDDGTTYFGNAKFSAFDCWDGDNEEDDGDCGFGEE